LVCQKTSCMRYKGQYSFVITSSLKNLVKPNCVPMGGGLCARPSLKTARHRSSDSTRNKRPSTDLNCYLCACVHRETQLFYSGLFAAEIATCCTACHRLSRDERRQIPDNESRMSTGDVPLTYGPIGRTSPQHRTTLCHLKTRHPTSMTCDQRHTLNTIISIIILYKP